MSVFNPDTFMDSTISEPNSTKVESVPPGEYRATVDEDIQPPKVITSQKGEQFIFLEINWNVDDDALKQKLGREKLQVRQSIRLDVTESGALDMGKGKNVGLGRLREALGMNSGPFNPRQLAGAGPALISVQLQKNNPDYSEVGKVGRIS